MRDIDVQIIKGQEEFFNVAKNKQIFSGKAIVSLDTEMDKEAVLYYQNRRHTFVSKVARLFRSCVRKNKELSTYRVQLGGQEMRVEQATEPTDVFWQNLKYSDSQLWKRRVVSRLITMLAIAVSCAVLLGLYYYQNQLKNGNVSLASEQYNLYLIKCASAIIAFFITVINKIMASVMNILSTYEKRPTRTEADTSKLVKLSWLLFINSALISMAISIFFTSSYFQQGGLVMSMSYLFITNMALTIAFQVVPVNYLYYLFRDRSFRKGTVSLSMNQEMANTHLQKMDFNISFYYASMTKDVFFTCFYASIIPGGIIVTLVGMCILYFLYKYNLLRRCSYRYELGADLAFAVLNLFEWGLVLYSGS